MRRKSSGEPCEPHPREAILILNLTSSKLYLPTHEPGPAVSRMHSYHHSGHSGNRGRGNDSSRASLTAAGEPKVARVSPLLGNGVSSLQHHRGAPQDPGPVAAPEMRPNGPKLQCSLVAQGELERLQRDAANWGRMPRLDARELFASPQLSVVPPDCAIHRSLFRDSPDIRGCKHRQTCPVQSPERPCLTSPMLSSPGRYLAPISSVRLGLLHLVTSFVQVKPQVRLSRGTLPNKTTNNTRGFGVRLPPRCD
jgi:hypothetical protein